MLTQFQTTEPQAAVLAACPRPRALAHVAYVGSVAATGFTSLSEWSYSAQSATSAASSRRHGLGIAEALRPFGATGLVERPAPAERQMPGYAPKTAVAADATTAAARPGYAAGGNGFIAVADSSNSVNSSKPQDKQYLTARRGPVTWRPPH